VSLKWTGPPAAQRPPITDPLREALIHVRHRLVRYGWRVADLAVGTIGDPGYDPHLAATAGEVAAADAGLSEGLDPAGGVEWSAIGSPSVPSRPPMRVVQGTPAVPGPAIPDPVLAADLDAQVQHMADLYRAMARPEVRRAARLYAELCGVIAAGPPDPCPSPPGLRPVLPVTRYRHRVDQRRDQVQAAVELAMHTLATEYGYLPGTTPAREPATRGAMTDGE